MSDDTVRIRTLEKLKEDRARIAALEAENAGWKRSHAVWCDDLANIDDLRQRAEHAEA